MVTEQLETMINAVLTRLRSVVQSANFARVERLDINAAGADEVSLNLTKVTPVSPSFNGSGDLLAEFDLLIRCMDPRTTAKAINLVQFCTKAFTKWEPIARYGSPRFVGADYRQYEGGLTFYVATFVTFVPLI